MSYAGPDADEYSPQPSEPLSAQEARRSYAVMIGCGSELAQRPTSTGLGVSGVWS